MTLDIDLTGLSPDETVTELCYAILKRAGHPLHYRKITNLLMQVKPLETKTPENSVYSRMLLDRKARFVKVSPGVFGLRGSEGKFSDDVLPMKPERKVRIPLFPLYSEMRLLLPVLDGRPRTSLTGYLNEIANLRGTPQEPRDWTDPDEWIPARLSGEEQQLAQAIWDSSKEQVNPRHIRGHWYLAKRYDLLAEDEDGTLFLTELGRDFIDHPLGETVQMLDRREGLIKLLSIVAERGPGKRGDFLPEWSRYLQAVSNFNSDSTFKDTLRRRLLNLVDRTLITRSGFTYQITQAGLDYLEEVGVETLDLGLALETPAPPDELHQIYELATRQRDAVREQLREILFDMDPYQFEDLVRRLLEEMGYEEVETTSPSNDKGVDVVGHIEVGITAVREVVQVKRYQSNIHRPVLDALRGSLHRFGAVRGTIINTSGFSKGTREAAFERSAAPITLIDGDKLIDLLIEHQLGVRKKAIEILELDETTLVSEEEEEAEA
jgi:restriction system protein